LKKRRGEKKMYDLINRLVEQTYSKMMNVDNESQNFRFNKLMDLLKDMEMGVRVITYYEDYVFPIGYQPFPEEEYMVTGALITDKIIGFYGMGENGGLSVFDFKDITEMKQSNNILHISFVNGFIELTLELPDNEYASILYDYLNLGMKGCSSEEIVCGVLG